MAEITFKLDKSGFPMVWIDTIEAYMHWLPVTKVQFEDFLCDAPDRHFDAEWYDEVLFLNPRISPNAIRANNYWQALLTGIKPGEIQDFARWCGNGFTIPTLKEWFDAYQLLKTLPPESSDVIKKMGKLRDRVKTVLARIDSASGKTILETSNDRTLADQMLMRMGVMEWVECPDNPRIRWGGMGQTNRNFHGSLFTPDHGQPNIPTNPGTDRLYHYGFRLIWREE